MHSSDSLMSWFQHCPLWQAVVCWVMKFACLSNIQQITGNSSLVHWYGRELANMDWITKGLQTWLIFTWLAQAVLANGNDRFGCRHIQTYKGDSA